MELVTVPGLLPDPPIPAWVIFPVPTLSVTQYPKCGLLMHLSGHCSEIALHTQSDAPYCRVFL